MHTISSRRDGEGRRATIVLVAALVVFIGGLAYVPTSAYGATAKPPPKKAAGKKPTKKKAKVEAGIRRGQLNVLGTAKSDKIALRLKPGNKSRLQVDVGGNGFAEFTFKRSAFNRIVVHGASGADALSINERFGVFTNTEATSLFGDTGNDLLRSGSAAERLFGGIGNDTIDGKRGNDLIEGGAGSDLVVFNGSNAAERFEFTANGKRLRFVARSTMNIAGVERFDLRASGGADNVVVNDLAGAGLGQLNADLANDRAADVVDIKGSSAANELRVGGGISIGGIGAAVNVLRAQAANDKLNIDPGAGSDRVTVEGTAGNDTIGVAPSAVAPHIAVSGGPAGLPIDVVNAETLAIEAVAGNDTLNGAVGLAARTQLTLDGGAGNDAINGGDGNDTLRGGTENDSIDGNRGDDTGLLGAGDDSFTWDPGDGSDKVEGEAGTDTMVFNGAGVAEDFDFSANGTRLKFFRNVANITMDVDGTERVDLRALGGIDNTVVNDLSATDVKNIVLDLATDGAVDTTTVNGTGGNDTIAIAPNAGAVDVTGLAAAVKIERSEANDVLNVNGLDGNDTISGAVGLAALIKLGIDGGAGDDTINGGDGAETLNGGDGNDAIDGNRGDDTGLLGAGDDSFTWDPGDGSDVVEGQDGADGADTLLFNGAGVAESFDVSANGERVRFFRDVANITMDLDDIEFIDVQALGGADSAVLNDLSGTRLKSVALDLEAAIGSGTGDGAADSVTVNGTNDPDDIQITADGSAVDVFGAQPNLRIDHSEAANDKLTVNGLGGADTVTAGPGLAALIQLVINGGTETDVLTGGDGNDRIAGQQGNDSMFGGSGDDTLVWDPGDANDLVEGQAGNDTMEFNGAAGNEAFEASAVDGRLRFTRNLGNIVMDVDGTENVDLRALGGADTAVVNDLTGTDVAKVNIDLAAAIGGGAGDAAADTVTVNGTNGPDNIAVAANGGIVDVTGLVTAVGINHSEIANDLLAINALGGDDDVVIGPGVADLIQTLVDLGGAE
jgi:Ca2+-binding RTX toxin-like protein